MTRLTLQELCNNYGISMTWIAKQIGMSRQQLHNRLVRDGGLTLAERVRLEESVRQLGTHLSEFKLRGSASV